MEKDRVSGSKAIDDGLLAEVNGGITIPVVSNLMMTNDTNAELMNPMAANKDEYQASPLQAGSLQAGSPLDPVSRRQKNDLLRKLPGEPPRLLKA